MLKQDSENQGAAQETTAKWPSGADSIRNQLSDDLEIIMNRCAIFMEFTEIDDEAAKKFYVHGLYGDLMDFASKYAVDDFFDR